MSDDDGYGLRERPAKRQRVEQQAPGPSGAPQATQQEAIEHLLYVRWFGGEGQTKLNKLKLRQVDNLDVSCCRGGCRPTSRPRTPQLAAQQRPVAAGSSSERAARARQTCCACCAYHCCCCCAVPRCAASPQELPKELIESHYPERHRLPDYFTNAAYVRFTPHVECLALPGEATAWVGDALEG